MKWVTYQALWNNLCLLCSSSELKIEKLRHFGVMFISGTADVAVLAGSELQSLSDRESLVGNAGLLSACWARSSPQNHHDERRRASLSCLVRNKAIEPDVGRRPSVH